MSRGICLVVCWAVAAGIAVGAGYMMGGVAGFPVLVSTIVTLMVFLGLAWALPAIVCGDAKTYDFEYSDEAKAAHAAAKGAPAPAPKAAPAPRASSPTPSAPAPATGGHWADTVAGSSGQASAGRGQTGLKPSAELTEEATLRDGVGGWKYGVEAKPGKVDLVSESPIDPIYGAKPATLSAARDGKADDLKKIKGVGPKMEGVLNKLGFYHFDQVAAWTGEELAWVDDNLDGFKGRASRDNWVEQAKLLATGGETEFSKKVDKGGVY